MGRQINLKDLAAVESFPGLSVRYLKENRVLPLKKEDGHILLAMAEPGNQELQSALEVALGVPVVPVEAREEDILEVIQEIYEPGSPMARLVSDLGAEEMRICGFQLLIEPPPDSLLLRPLHFVKFGLEVLRHGFKL